MENNGLKTVYLSYRTVFCNVKSTWVDCSNAFPFFFFFDGLSEIKIVWRRLNSSRNFSKQLAFQILQQIFEQYQLHDDTENWETKEK